METRPQPDDAPGIDSDNLVVLQYASNHLYTNAADPEEAGVEIDEEEGTWSHGMWEDVPIGEARNPYHRGRRYREGVIGVYDRRDTEQLNRMVRDSRRFTQTDSPALPRF